MTPIAVSLISFIYPFTNADPTRKTPLTLRVLGAKFNSYFPRPRLAKQSLERPVIPLLEINACVPPQTSLWLRKTVTQNGGMVSVVFLLIIAYRPLIQSPLLNLAERLAGEDLYRVLLNT